MDSPSKNVSERTRRQLEQLPPEKRSKAEVVVEMTQTPEYRERVAAERAILDQEYRETGMIAGAKSSEVLAAFFSTLKEKRLALGLTLAE